jgi:gliding motility-associated-like protein
MNCKLFFIIILTTCFSKTIGQTITINSITASRQPYGDQGYTLDGIRMSLLARVKLLNSYNFSSIGIYPKSVAIIDGYGSSGSLTSISSVPTNQIFFFGSFNKLDLSTQQFTPAEIDSLYNWSLRGGKLIIASGGTYGTIADGEILDNKWGYTYQSLVPRGFFPTVSGNATDIFNGSFGNVNIAMQGGAAQGFFSSLTSNYVVFATDDENGNPTLFMDCNTLDLIVSDVDAFTDLGGVTGNGSINSTQDKFWVNTIVFMDKLQPPPVLTDNANILSLNSNYNSYQWYYNGAIISGANTPTLNAENNGNYQVEVTVNGGCQIKSNIIAVDTSDIMPLSNHPYIQDTLIVPNVFTPNFDGRNDIFKPFQQQGIKINQITIYNRWGSEIHKEKDPSILWNGKIGNENASEGVYFWIIEYENSKQKHYTQKGEVQLLH